MQIEPSLSGSILLEKVEPTPAPHVKIPRTGAQSPIDLPIDKPDLALPDLVTLPPTDLRMRVNPVTGQRLLRFTNSIMNAGPGKMEIWGEKDPTNGKTTVTQYIYNDTEGLMDKKTVGEFFFHPEHHHWHFGDFARYEIWSLDEDGQLNFMVATSNKVSYCLRDDARSGIPNASVWQSYTSCNSERQGISVGWIDIYRYHLPGQEIDITFLNDGIYALRSTVNPENKLSETIYTNNAFNLYIIITGDTFRIVDPQVIYNRTLDNRYE